MKSQWSSGSRLRWMDTLVLVVWNSSVHHGHSTPCSGYGPLGGFCAHVFSYNNYRRSALAMYVSLGYSAGGLMVKHQWMPLDVADIDDDGHVNPFCWFVFQMNEFTLAQYSPPGLGLLPDHLPNPRSVILIWSIHHYILLGYPLLHYA